MPARDVNHFDRRARCQQLNRSFRNLPGHDFGPLRASLHMTVMAGLIAQLADVDLQRPGFFPYKRPVVMRRQGSFKVGRDDVKVS